MKPLDIASRVSPLVYPAALLSIGSLVWTSWSLIDLLGVGAVGVTVAAGADVIWASVIVAEYRGLRIAGRRWTVPALGWLTLLAVAGFLAWHGIEKNIIAMAVAGPFLPLGAKAVWSLALADMRDPAALTDDEKHALAAMERGMAFEEAQHRITMRRREMQADLHMTEVGTDFDIELMRRNKERELHRHRPLAIDPLPAAPVALPASGGAPQDAPADTPPHQGEADQAPQDAPREPAQTDEPDRPLLVPVPPHGTGQPAAALDLAALPKSEAVLLMKEKHPADSAPQLARRLAGHGVEVSDGYVRTALGRARSKAQQNEPQPGEGFYP